MKLRVILMLMALLAPFALARTAKAAEAVAAEAVAAEAEAADVQAAAGTADAVKAKKDDKSDAKDGKPDDKAAAAAKKEKDKEKSNIITGGRFVGDPIYVHLAPLLLPVVTDNGAEQLVNLIVDLRVKNFSAADNLHDNMPRIRDALMQTLYGGLGRGSLRDGPLVNVGKVKSKIGDAVDKVMGPNSVEEVLIQAVSQRKL